MRTLRFVRLTAGSLLLAYTLCPGSLLSAPRQASSFDKLAQRAKEASESNRLEEAAAVYARALKLRPSWAEGWWALGTIEYDRSAYPAAAAAFRRVIVLQPKRGSPRIMLGLCQFELGDDDNALKNIEEGKRLGSHPEAEFQHVMLYHEGVLLLRKSRFESASETLSQLSKEGVQSDELTLGLGMAALRMLPKDLPADAAPGREVVRRVGQAEALFARKQFDEAREMYKNLVSSYSTFPNLQYAYGRFLLNVNDPEEAIVAFQQELRNAPQSVPARLRIASVKYTSDPAGGLPYAREAVKLAPRLPFAHYLLGLLLLDTGDIEHAISELEIARTSLDHDSGLFFALGNAYAKAGRKADAARARAIFVRLKKQDENKNAEEFYGERPAAPSAEGMDEAAASPPL